MATLVFDIESFRDYTLVMFRDMISAKTAAFEQYEGRPFDVKSVRGVLARNTIVGYNSANFDLPLLGLLLSGADCATVHAACQRLIAGEPAWQIGLESPECDHIDLMEVAPGQASLKLYGARLHAPTIRELPFDPQASITPAMRQTVIDYCGNDLDLIVALYRALAKQIDLRCDMGRTYGVDLRSKSDAQIAETVIYQEVAKSRGDLPPKKVKVRAGESFRYDPPGFLRPAPEVEFAAGCEFIIGDNGAPCCPELEGHEVRIGESIYRMGIGGLHSCEKSVAHVADANTVLIDRDVASYYPSIIRRLGLYPKHLGPAFSKVYARLIEERLAAKRAGNKTVADTFKIVLNGTFGKLGSRYSCLYSPKLLIQVTLTGQLALLMLIRAIEQAGIRVISANTDGIVIACPRDRIAALDEIIWYWESLTGFETEETRYKAIYARDVNNYLAIKEDGSIKSKGALASAGLAKNPVAEVVVDAIVAYLKDGVAVRETIESCRDLTRFLIVRNVSGGAVTSDGKAIGKVARWYFGRNRQGALYYAKNGNKVPASDGAIPCQTLPEDFPDDIDHDVYVGMAMKTITSMGARQ
ncbi:MAG: hypothetical protein N2690_06365 [Rhodocyclaceae bacterium]|nr:hypothetical protein [Rhodocyclaceae bacterium]